MVMKLLSTLFCLGLAAIPVSASVASDVDARRAAEVGKKHEVFKTRLGWTYRDVTVTKVTDAGISIIHSDGTARLGYERLTPEQRETFGVTRDGEKAVHAQEYQNKAAHEARIVERQKKWQAEQVARQTERQIAYEAQQERQTLVAKPVAAPATLAEAVAQPAQPAQPTQGTQVAQQAQGTTSIVSTLEVPHFPIIRGTDNQILYPIQHAPRTYRRSYSRGGNTIYYGGYGGSYGYPVRYSSGCYGGYPSRYGSYRPSYSRGTSGAINYRTGNWNIGIRW